MNTRIKRRAKGNLRAAPVHWSTASLRLAEKVVDLSPFQLYGRQLVNQASEHHHETIFKRFAVTVLVVKPAARRSSGTQSRNQTSPERP
jgi:hypothetical protein